MRSERYQLTKWKAIAPTVHDYFGLSAEDRHNALVAARLQPRRALRCYRIIVGTLRPHLPAGMRG